MIIVPPLIYLVRDPVSVYSAIALDIIVFSISHHVMSPLLSEMQPLLLQTFVILPKEKTTVWVEQNGNFFQQNGSVIKIEQN
jgi:hypothetical protein